MKKRVTIQDIADALGISRNTVSKAINNSEGLAEATRERILQKAVEMGYKQFSYLETLSKITGSEAPQEKPGVYIGEIALFSTMFLTQSHFSAMVLDRLQRETGELGYIINIHRVTKDNLKNLTLPVTFRPEHTSAILCVEMFDYAYERRWVDFNPARAFKVTHLIREIEEEKKVKQVFSPKDIKKMWKYVDVTPYTDMVLIGLYTGFRPQELAILEIDNIDLAEGSIIGGMKTRRSCSSGRMSRRAKTW